MRLFGSNVRPDDVEQIELHNGVLPSQLEQIIEQMPGGQAQRAIQENGREPIYVKEGVMFIPQYSSFERGMRYEMMIDKYLTASGRGLKRKFCELGSNKRVTYIAYDNNAYDFVVGMFVPSQKYEDRRVFQNHTIREISTIIVGPVGAVSKRAIVIEQGKSEYLDAQIVEIDGKKALNLGYIYGGQGGLIISKMMREYAAIAEQENRPRNIDVMMFGRVGGISESMQRHDLVFPTGIIDWVQLTRGNALVHPVNNIAALRRRGELILNVQSVLDETEEQLRIAKSVGCLAVEMETRDMIDAIDQAHRRHYPNITINFSFAGHVSDIPLRGDTLEEELDSDKGEQEALSAILSAIS
jgi:hypothetical protein